MTADSTANLSPAVGIIMLDTRFPRIPGDVGNPATFAFPVRYQVVEGASVKRVVEQADPALLEPFVEAARTLVQAGVRAIATSCGFLAIFHRRLADAITVPLYSSALLQIPLAQAVLRSGQTVGIITADRRSLTRRHFDGIGISRMPAAIVGMEAAAEFSAVFLGDKSELDPGRCREEMVAAARRLLKAHPTVGAIILECTNMPPYAAAVQAETGLPVYDVTTLIRLAYQAALRRPYQTPFEA